jgi:L-threonylcarbamoyladenylate synthase
MRRRFASRTPGSTPEQPARNGCRAIEVGVSVQKWRAKLVAQRLLQGAVIAYPTEGVWGLGCLPHNEEAVSRILALKRRSREEGLILVAGEIDQVEEYLAGLEASERQTLESSWPGPVTFLVPDAGIAPDWIRGRHDTVALRVSDHPVIRSICGELGGPIVSTSANPAGKKPADSMLRLRQYFPSGIDYIFPGQLGGECGPSEIRVLRTGEVLRAAGTGRRP